MSDPDVERVAEALWGSPANKRAVTWASMDEKTKELWRDDARRAIAAMEAYDHD